MTNWIGQKNTGGNDVALAEHSINPEVVQQKIGIAFGAFGGSITAVMVHLGHKLGLYRGMAGQGAITAAQLAAATGLSERFVSEWLSQQAASGIVDIKGGGAFELGTEAALVFADDNNPMSQIATFAYLPAMMNVFLIAEGAFRTGLGNTYDAYGEEVARAMDASFGAWNRNALVPEALPKIPGLVERLTAGARVADVGCGAGAGPIAIAQAFPRSRVDGYDNSLHALRVAGENRAAAGVTNVDFHNSDSDPLPSVPTFDFVMTLDCMHDMARPDLAAAAIRKAIKPDGVWFIVDIDGKATTEENLANPMAAFLYGASIGICLQSSASTADGLALGTFGLPEPKMRDVVAAAGFTSSRRVEGLMHPFNAYYEVRP